MRALQIVKARVALESVQNVVKIRDVFDTQPDKFRFGPYIFVRTSAFAHMDEGVHGPFVDYISHAGKFADIVLRFQLHRDDADRCLLRVYTKKGISKQLLSTFMQYENLNINNDLDLAVSLPTLKYMIARFDDIYSSKDF